MKLLPGINLTFSWKRALGITRLKSRFSRSTGIPTTVGGLQRKVGRSLIELLLGRRK